VNAHAAQSSIAILAIAALSSLGFVAPAAHADTTCGDVCTIGNITQTPLGVVTVTTDSTNVVTVHLEPITPRTIVFGVPFAIPPGPPALPGYTRTSVDAGLGGTVEVDTLVVSSGLRSFLTLPSLAIISIQPPSPCRVVTVGDTVVFTPIS
jgi:hypothetical protein